MLQNLVRRLFIVKMQGALPDQVGPLLTEHRINEAVKLGGDLLLGHRVLVMPGRKGDLLDQGRAVEELDRETIGDAGGIARSERRVLDDSGARNQVENTRVGQTLRGELLGRDTAIDERDDGAIGEAMVGRFTRLGPPFLGVLADDLDRRAKRGDFDRFDPRRLFDSLLGV